MATNAGKAPLHIAASPSRSAAPAASCNESDADLPRANKCCHGDLFFCYVRGACDVALALQALALQMPRKSCTLAALASSPRHLHTLSVFPRCIQSLRSWQGAQARTPRCP